jgi:glycerol-3-phosphate acyltransferase PlsY
MVLSLLSQAATGSIVLAAVLSAVVAYFCGCFNGAVIVSKYILRDDVRTHGSGNAGLTNFHRTFGGPLTAVVVLTDVLKAIVALLVGMALARHFLGADALLVTLGKYWAGLFCLLGHMFPCAFGFRGGKGILSGGTIAIMIDWRIALLVWGSFLVLAVLTRYVSLGSVSTGFLFPVGSGLVYRDPVIFVLSLVIGVLIVWKHRGNIQRLLSGTESKFSLHKKTGGTQ